MAKKADELDALVARRVFAWKTIRRDAQGLHGKKPDKLGRWRSTRVPHYSTNPLDAYAIDEKMKQLGLAKPYTSELSKLTRSTGIPADWATPEQRCRAALKTVACRTGLRLLKR